MNKNLWKSLLCFVKSGLYCHLKWFVWGYTILLHQKIHMFSILFKIWTKNDCKGYFQSCLLFYTFQGFIFAEFYLLEKLYSEGFSWQNSWQFNIRHLWMASDSPKYVVARPPWRWPPRPLKRGSSAGSPWGAHSTSWHTVRNAAQGDRLEADGGRRGCGLGGHGGCYARSRVV